MSDNINNLIIRYITRNLLNLLERLLTVLHNEGKLESH